MELLQLKYFCDAAKTENFSKTAKKFGVPPSNISQTIHRLENELDTLLFLRSANKVTLSDTGKFFYKEIKSALSVIDDAKKAAAYNSKSIHGEINLKILTNRRIVTEAIEHFRKLYPDVTFNLSHNANTLLSPDIVISDTFPDDKNMSHTLLVTEDINIAMEKSNPLATKKNISVSDIKNERFITMPKGTSQYKITHDICQTADFVPNIVVQTDDPFYIRKYIELGLGIAIVPSLSWKGQFSDNVICKKIGNLKRNTYVFRRKNISRATDEFIRILFEQKLY